MSAGFSREEALMLFFRITKALGLSGGPTRAIAAILLAWKASLCLQYH